MLVSGSGGQASHTFEVSRQADPKDIRPRTDGTEGLRVDADGNLVIGTSADPIVHSRPAVFQRSDGGARHLDGRFVADKDMVGFGVSGRTPGASMLIDPTILAAACRRQTRRDSTPAGEVVGRGFDSAFHRSEDRALVGETVRTTCRQPSAPSAAEREISRPTADFTSDAYGYSEQWEDPCPPAAFFEHPHRP